MVQLIQMRVIVAVSVITLSLRKAESASSRKICTLEEMRELAANACDHMFMREKRQVSNSLLNSWATPKGVVNNLRHPSKGVKVRRRDFPEGGYLIIDHKYAKILSQRIEKPKYHVIDWHSKKFVGMNYRSKRANSATIGITYCCTHKCSPLDICLASRK